MYLKVGTPVGFTLSQFVVLYIQFLISCMKALSKNRVLKALKMLALAIT
jgi:hypothetical protein